MKPQEIIIQSPLVNNVGYCSGYVCHHSKIKFIPSFKCHEKVSIIKRITPNPGCLVNGRYYHVGDTIESGVDAKGCQFGTICMEDGSQTTIHEPGCPTTTFIPTTLGAPSGYCYYNGQHYSPGTVIQKGQSGTWCYITLCDSDGNILNGDDFHCTTPTTVQPTTIPVIPVG